MKRWTSLGLGTAIIGTTLVACGNAETDAPSSDVHKVESTTDAGHVDHGEMGEGGEGVESGEAGHHNMDALPTEHRLAFMRGHVEAGLALYRAGEPEMAAPHLLHPVSETHAAEREGLDALGFDGELFETVSVALEIGMPAADIEPQLKKAEANLQLVSKKAGGDAAGIINFLMETIVEEYTIAITDGQVTDPGEYQDAYGFSIVAKQTAGFLSADVQADVISKIDALIKLWPENGPIPPAKPTPIAQVVAKTSEIQLLLPAH